MALTPWRQLLAYHLARANVAYQANIAEEELATLAEIFDEALAGTDPRTVTAAFALHMKTCKRFPTPAHIVELLPECYKRPAQLEALPEAPGKHTPGFGAAMGREILAKIRGQRPEPESAGTVAARVLATLSKEALVQ